MKRSAVIGIVIVIGVFSIGLLWYYFFRAPSSLEPQIVFPAARPTLAPVLSQTDITLRLDNFFDDTQFHDIRNKEDYIVLRATGDVMPARSVNTQTVRRGDFTWAFQPTAELLKNADITLINLETPLLESCPLTDTGMVFCGSTQHVNGLRFAGIDVVNVANNHTENFGFDGVEQTLTALQKNGLGITGMGIPYMTTVKGIRFGFLGYNDIITGQDIISVTDDNRMVEEIQSLKNIADVIVVSFHWGIEYTNTPSLRQRTIAHKAIDAGADLIIGNHPHWIQPVEIYKNRVIMYSHGNFIFDQMWSEETRIGVIGTYVFSGKELRDIIFDPVKIYDYGQPRLLDAPDKQKIIDALKRESYNHAAVITQ